jgi:glucoamylase
MMSSGLSFRLVVCTYILAIFPVALGSSISKASENFDSWLTKQTQMSHQYLLNDISPEGTVPGVVIAAPSRHSPDYYFHWVRDAALVMDVIVTDYERASSIEEQEKYLSLLFNYAEFSRRNQETPTPSGGLGEPKFNVDGSAFYGPWGRPQNDGPALRAVVLTRFAKLLLKRGLNTNWIRERLYDSRIPTHSVIKSDLEYTAYHWKESSYDLWEETRGQHFYTRMVQRRALIDGSELAFLLGDVGAGLWYQRQAKLLEVEIEKHWDPKQEQITATVDWDGGNPYKSSGLDVAVILGILHGSRQDGFFDPDHEKVLSTAFKLQNEFKKIFAVNQNEEVGVAIGRYPEDIYDGYSIGVQEGNPWFLATSGYAEYFYRVALQWRHAGEIRVTSTNLNFLRSLVKSNSVSQALAPGQNLQADQEVFQILLRSIQEEADLFLKRVQLHTPNDGQFSEQYNRITGYLQGAPHLAWSYASFLTAIWEKQEFKLEKE